MKHTVLAILLLGFGCMAPTTCSQKKQKKEQSEKREQQKPSTLAFGGPCLKVMLLKQV
jgi:hypothetical protein